MMFHICFQGAPPETSAPAHLPPCCATPAASGVSSDDRLPGRVAARPLFPKVSDSETSGVPAADRDRGALCRGVEQLVARQAHNLKAAGSSPASATRSSAQTCSAENGADGSNAGIKPGVTAGETAIPSVTDQRPAPHTDLCGAFTHRWRLPTAISERELMRAYGASISILVLGALTACGIACSWGIWPW